jgi:hypothetical protein
MQMRNQATPTAEPGVQSPQSFHRFTTAQNLHIYCRRPTTINLSLQFRDRGYPLEYVSPKLRMTNSLLSLVTEPEGSTLLTKPATGYKQEPIPFQINFNANHSIASSVTATFQEVHSLKFCIRLSPSYELMLVIQQ